MPVYREAGESTLYDVVKVKTCSGQPLEVTTSSGDINYIQPGGVAGDAFGRLRVSEPFTLFDSSHRYSINGHWNTSSGNGGTLAFNAAQGLVDLAVTTTSGSKVYRETNRVFSYQPGKSLLILNTFVMASGETNLRQRAGYFGTNNGIYFQVSGTTSSFVKRSYVSGSVVETIVPKTSWNGDKLDGTGKSGFTLDPTKAQIFFCDFEWLGVGTVRAGFVINGQVVLCHSFHHANVENSTYITTATLPMRYEIEALGTLSGAKTMKQICSSVLSEGGYELRGDSNSVGTPLNTPRTFTNSGVFYPVAAIRLKASPDRLDAVVIPNSVSILGQGNNAVFNWKIVNGGTVSGGTWTSAGANSPVEYNLSGVSISGGTDLSAGFISANTQSANALEITTNQFFKYQLERDSFTSTPTELILAVASKVSNDTAYITLDWEELAR